MAAFATAFSGGQRPHYLQRHPRYRSKVSSPHFRPPRIQILFLFFMFVVLLWNRHNEMISTVSSWNPADSHSSFTYGPVRVDNVIAYDGNANRIDISAADAGAHHDSVHGRPDPSQIQHEHHSHQVDLNMLKDDNIDPQHAAVHSNAELEGTGTAGSHDSNTSIGELSLNSTSQVTKLHDAPQEPGGVVDLKKYLNFSDHTAINFMHFHKTGGVSFKTALHKFYNGKYKSNGHAVVVRDACYAREGVKRDGQPSFKLWRCDWEPLKEQGEEERNLHDFVFGHQFREKGVEELLSKRDLRTFTVLRHPFDRKVSFFYHFFVREVGRKEEDITFQEIRNFLLYDKLEIRADLGRDLGPNYMAGRLLSDGIQGFKGNSSYSFFRIDEAEAAEVVERALEVIRGYAFVGLQSQSEASQCMLRKVMEEFNSVNGVSNDGIEEVDKGNMRLNSGSYSLSAKAIWSRFTAEDRALFDLKEGVDLSIFREGERLFGKHLEIFNCSHRLSEYK